MAVWSLDEASGTRANQSVTSCGANCNLAPTNNPTNDTVNFREGTASGNFARASARYLSCAIGSTCGPLNLNGNFTLVGWLRPASLPSSGNVLSWIDSETNASTGGYFANIDSARSNHYTCGICNLSGACNETDSGIAGAVGAWRHVACQYTASAHSLQTFVDGAASGPAMTSLTYVPESGGTIFTVSNISPHTWDGDIDEVGVHPGAVAASSICRISRCGIDGSLCRCDGTTPTQYKSCTTDADCGTTGKCNAGTCSGRALACALPACNTSQP